MNKSTENNYVFKPTEFKKRMHRNTVIYIVMGAVFIIIGVVLKLMDKTSLSIFIFGVVCILLGILFSSKKYQRYAFKNMGAAPTDEKTNDEKSDGIDSLVKLKEAMDNGYITQEEFDAKKKQILGL